MRDAHFGFGARVWPRDVTRAVVTAICQPRGRPPLAGGAEIRNPELSARSRRRNPSCELTRTAAPSTRMRNSYRRPCHAVSANSVTTAVPQREPA